MPRMAKLSAGIFVYRRGENGLEVFIAHSGGPFFAKKDEGAWSVPKGEYDEGEDAYEAAHREFREEIGQEINGEAIELAPVTQKGGKIVRAWAIEGDIDPTQVKSNEFEMEWPTRSGKKQSFPEIDRAEWFSPEEAKKKVRPAQAAFIDELVSRL